MASELVTNVVRHANKELDVSPEFDGDRVRIEVAYGSAPIPALRDLRRGIDATGGGGLRLVETISEDWGADQRSGGTAVYAEIRI